MPDYYLADASRVQLSLELSKGWIYFPIISSRRAGSEGMTAEGYTCYFLTGNTSSDVLVLQVLTVRVQVNQWVYVNYHHIF
jgi:hypothetical protein